MSPILLYTLGGLAVAGTVGGFALLGRSKDEPAKKKSATKPPPKEEGEPEPEEETPATEEETPGTDEGGGAVGGFGPQPCTERLTHQVYFDDSGLPAFTLASGAAIAIEGAPKIFTIKKQGGILMLDHIDDDMSDVMRIGVSETILPAEFLGGQLESLLSGPIPDGSYPIEVAILSDELAAVIGSDVGVRAAAEAGGVGAYMPVVTFACAGNLEAVGRDAPAAGARPQPGRTTKTVGRQKTGRPASEGAAGSSGSGRGSWNVTPATAPKGRGDIERMVRRMASKGRNADGYISEQRVDLFQQRGLTPPMPPNFYADKWDGSSTFSLRRFGWVEIPAKDINWPGLRGAMSAYGVTGDVLIPVWWYIWRRGERIERGRNKGEERFDNNDKDKSRKWSVAWAAAVPGATSAMYDVTHMPSKFAKEMRTISWASDMMADKIEDELIRGTDWGRFVEEQGRRAGAGGRPL
jgi:hypothetical protein